MIAFVTLAVALGTPFLRLASATPIVLAAQATVTVTVTAADVCMPIGSAVPLVGVASSAAAPVLSSVASNGNSAGSAVISALSATAAAPSIVSAATVFAGGVTSSAISVAGAVVTAVPSVVSAAAVAVSSSGAAVDASLVSAVGKTQIALSAELTAANVLANTIILIAKNLASNSIPESVITTLIQNTSNLAAALNTLTQAAAAGAAQATSTYFTSTIASFTNDLNTLTVQLEPLQTAGPAFTAQFVAPLSALSKSWNLFAASCKGNNNANLIATAAAKFSTAVSALSN